MEKWLSIVAASRLLKAKPEEKELLMHWANVVEYVCGWEMRDILRLKQILILGL